MTSTTLARNGNGITFLKEPAESPAKGAERLLPPAHGPATGADHRAHSAAPAPPLLEWQEPRPDGRHALAVFCFEPPDGEIGRHVARTAAALARRKTPVYLFTRHDFALSRPDLFEFPLGDCAGENLPGSVQEFARRACNMFLQQFPAGCPGVTLLGYEWSAAPALSLLRGLKNVRSILSVHSLERQRSDLTSDLSKQIEQIELAGLREASALLIQEPAAAEVAKYWVPECADKIVPARPRFPAHHFQTVQDPGRIKARHEVGPVDPTILYVGDLSERYGPDLLLKAMPALLKNNKQVRLIVAGDGDLFWPLRVYARYLLLEHAVRLPGSVEGRAAHELIQAADVVCVPSRETTPWWPVLAAWAAGKPVVATHQAAPALLEHERDSVLFYPSENSCVWGVERVLFDANFARSIAEQGHAKLDERFGWNCAAEQIEELMAARAVR
jgi:glycosyltransferase involved in cell wall biosynthesis